MVSRSSLLGFQQHWFNIIQVFSNVDPLAKLVLRVSTPTSEDGSAYADTLLGALLSLSCLPKKHGAPYDYFDRPLVHQAANTEGNIWSALDVISENLYKIFHSLLKCSPDTKHMTLRWLGRCLKANSARGHIWNSQGNYGATPTASDGFMLNLGSVLLRLCLPFCAR